METIFLVTRFVHDHKYNSKHSIIIIQKANLMYNEKYFLKQLDRENHSKYDICLSINQVKMHCNSEP